MPNDEYNTYRYDFVDGFERERRVEYLSSTLQENQKWLDSYGILSETVEITEMECANLLMITPTDITIQVEFNTKGSDQTIDGFVFHNNEITNIKPILKTEFEKLFPDYGEINSGLTGDLARYNGTTKAIRVWSGADHWLLPKESALKYLRVLPIKGADNNTPNVGKDDMLVLIYWPDSYGSLAYVYNKQDLYRMRNAYLCIPGKAVKHT